MLAALTAVTTLAATVLLGAGSARAADFSTGAVEVAPTTTTQTVVSAVNVGHHSGFDRLVFTFTGPLPGYTAAYVQRLTHDASGARLTPQGSSFALITLRPTSTTDHAPQQTLTPHFPMLRQVVGAGDFEAVTSYGVGLTGTSGMRVFTLTGPNRLVVDFAIPGDTPPSGTDRTTSAIPGPPAGGASTESAVSPDAPAPPGSAVPAPPHRTTPVLPVALGAAGLLVLSLAGYHLLHRRPV